MDIQETLSLTSPSCSSSSPNMKYDVFISFRGEDTRTNFTDHLYKALSVEGIFTFKDDKELERGKSISADLMQAIEQSRTALVVFSRTYASSKWCLDELNKILECKNQQGQTVLPIFYHVSPSDVRKQTGTFADAFHAHEKFKHNLENVQRWRNTLTEIANLSGFHLKDGHESKFIEEIVENILLRGGLRSTLSRDYVGMGFRVREMMKLCVGIQKENDVGFIGIWGMGGIGKTTLARCFVDQIFNQFDVVSFLDNVREVTTNPKDGLVTEEGLDALRKKLLSNCQMSIGSNKGNDGYGIKHRLRSKKVLLILDDVNHSKQIQEFAGNGDWFGRGSRIIITTRDKHILVAHQVDEIYEAKKLKDDEALDLLCCKAFKNGNHDAKEYMGLPYKFVKYAKGLPLAIEVLGNFLCGRSAAEWESTYINTQLGNLDNEIMSSLEIGFGGLREQEKNIFLDIACFFKGQNRDHAEMILESIGFHPNIVINVLIEKALITMVHGKLWMHDLLQEMGWQKILQELGEPKSRLWRWEDALAVLQNKKGTHAVEGIVLNLPQDRKLQLKHDAFIEMKKLRFLKIISDVLLPQGLSYLSTEMGVVEWHGYPSNLLPPNFPSTKLVSLKMCGSHMKHLWKGYKALNKLKYIELSDSENLIETPDFTGVLNLVTLILKGCTKLHKVHPSIGTLKHLVLLNMENCRSLERFPCKISLEHLDTFILSGCARLERFPDIVGSMGSLSKLYLDGTALQELPLSIQNLTGLRLIDLRDCKNLVRISSGIGSLTSVKSFTLLGCTNLQEIPEEIGGMENLEELDLSGTAIIHVPWSVTYLKKLKLLSCAECKGQPLEMLCLLQALHPGMGLSLPRSLAGLCSLTNLNLSYCNLLDSGLPNDLDTLPKLANLNLMGNNMTSIPVSINQLSHLKELCVRYCSNLESLPKLPLSIERVIADCCTSLISDSVRYEVWNSWHNTKEHKLEIVQRSRSHTYSFVVSAVQFVAWLQRVHEVEISQPLRTTYGFSAGANIVPQWFKIQSNTSFVTLLLPTELYNKRSGPWMGYALYVCFVAPDNFDVSRALKVRHEFVCCFDTGEGSQQNYTLSHELDVSIPFTGPNGHWLYITHAWFLQRLNALNQCTSIGTYTVTDCPGVEVKCSGARLLYKRDFKGFIEAITSNDWRSLRSGPSESSSMSHLAKWKEESQGCNIGSTMTLKERLKALPLNCYQSLLIFGGQKYVIQGNLYSSFAFALGEILQEYYGDNIFYTNCFQQRKIPEWFCHDVRSSDFMRDWKGIAVCVAYTVHGPHTLTLVNLDMKYTLRTSTGLSEEKIHHVTESTKEELILLKQQDFIWISYISRGSFPENVTLNDSMEVVCHEFSQDLKVDKGAYQLVLLQDDMEGFIEAIVQCSTN